jgi:hypothetical protein
MNDLVSNANQYHPWRSSQRLIIVVKTRKKSTTMLCDAFTILTFRFMNFDREAITQIALGGHFLTTRAPWPNQQLYVILNPPLVPCAKDTLPALVKSRPMLKR